MGKFGFGGVPITIKKMPHSTFATRAPTINNNMSNTIVFHHNFGHSQFSTTMTKFYLMATLCEDGNIIRMSTIPIDELGLIITS
jgi:hypothetical protein